MRVSIIGNSGSGKSTLAKRLAIRHNLDMLDLDSVAWMPGEVAVRRPPEDAVADVQAFCESHDRWIIEGCYAGLVEATFAYSPTLVFLNPGVEVCKANCQERPWEPHKYASKQEQDEMLAFLLTWVSEYYTRDGDLSLVAHQALYDNYKGPKQQVLDRPAPDFTLIRG